MDSMTIENAKYTSSTKKIIEAIVNGEKVFVPLVVGNRHYDEIKKQVDAGTLTIADAD
tara:strand:+ start:927 stop:1100 length:174 start_codon:yes stop_codon:yes gene_type:complete